MDERRESYSQGFLSFSMRNVGECVSFLDCHSKVSQTGRLVFSQSGSWKPETKMWAGLVSAAGHEGGACAKRMTLFSLCLPPFHVCDQIASYKDTSQVGLGPTLMTSL